MVPTLDYPGRPNAYSTKAAPCNLSNFFVMCDQNDGPTRLSTWSLSTSKTTLHWLESSIITHIIIEYGDSSKLTNTWNLVQPSNTWNLVQPSIYIVFYSPYIKAIIMRRYKKYWLAWSCLLLAHMATKPASDIYHNFFVLKKSELWHVSPSDDG